jgi:hypothetical protein
VTVKALFPNWADFAGVCVTPATLLDQSSCRAEMAGTTDITISYHIVCFRLDDSEQWGAREYDYFSDTKLGRGAKGRATT